MDKNKPLSEVVRTAPERIYLQVSDADDKHRPFPEDSDDVTWCADSCVDTEVEYVRVDLVKTHQRKLIEGKS